jgi:hypothetical protein
MLGLICSARATCAGARASNPALVAHAWPAQLAGVADAAWLATAYRAARRSPVADFVAEEHRSTIAHSQPAGSRDMSLMHAHHKRVATVDLSNSPVMLRCCSAALCRRCVRLARCRFSSRHCAARETRSAKREMLTWLQGNTREAALSTHREPHAQQQEVRSRTPPAGNLHSSVLVSTTLPTAALTRALLAAHLRACRRA